MQECLKLYEMASLHVLTADEVTQMACLQTELARLNTEYWLRERRYSKTENDCPHCAFRESYLPCFRSPTFEFNPWLRLECAGKNRSCIDFL